MTILGIILAVVIFAIVMFFIRPIAWAFRGLAVIIALLLKPDEGAKPRPLRPKGLGMRPFVKLDWEKARRMYVPSRRLK